MKKGSRNFLRSHLPWFMAAIVVLIIVVVLGYYTFREEKEEELDLMVDEVYFKTKASELGGSTTDIDIVVFVTNQKENDVEKVVLRAFAVDTSSNLARDEARTVIGRLPGDKTEEGLLSIKVPNSDTYRIEIIVFANDKIAIRGSGTVDLTGIGTASDYHNLDDDDSDDGNYYSEGPWAPTMGADASPVVCIFFLMVAGAVALVVVIIVAVVKAVKKAETPPVQGIPSEAYRYRSTLTGPMPQELSEAAPKAEAPQGPEGPDDRKVPSESSQRDFE